MRGIRRGVLAVSAVGLMFSGAAAFGGATTSTKASNALTNTDKCILLDAGLDQSIASGPKSGPGHDALENAEKVTLDIQGCPSETIPTLTTSTPATVRIGSPAVDTATLVGGDLATGSITYKLTKSADCTGKVLFSFTDPNVNGPDTFTSPPFTPATMGTYSWSVTYSGDDENPPVKAVCEPFKVVKATPDLTTTFPAKVKKGAKVHDTAHLTGGFDATGKISFATFGGFDCKGRGLPVPPPATVNGDGTYTSGTITAGTAGKFSWSASYNGDANNAGANSPCENYTVK